MVAYFNACYEWIPSSNGRRHDGAIEGGFTSNGEKLYIGRIRHDGVMTYGKIHPSNGGLFIAYGSKEHPYQHGYEILVSKGFRGYNPPTQHAGFVWVKSSGGEKVVGAIDGGDGMYVGRAFHQRDLIPGKVHCAHRSLYISWGK